MISDIAHRLRCAVSSICFQERVVVVVEMVVVVEISAIGPLNEM